MLVRSALRNVLRHKSRTAFTLAVIAFGVAALIVTGGFVENLYRQLGEAIIHSQSGHLQVAQPAWFAEGSRSPEKHLIPEIESARSQLARLSGASEVAARLLFAGLLSGNGAELPIVGEGFEPEKEAGLTSALTIVSGRPLRAGDPYGALIGEGLAQELSLATNDRVTLLASTIDGALNTVDLEVVGVFRSFSRDYDARALKVPLAAAQELVGTAQANVLVVLLDDTLQTGQARRAASALMQPRGLAVKTWEQLNDFYRNTVLLYERQFGVLTVIILVMVALGVGNAVSMAVFERVAEFGTMRALGNRSAHIFRLIMLESTAVGAIGSILGVIAGAGAAWLISAIGIPMPPPPNSNLGFTAAVELLPGVMLEAFAVGFAATLLSALLPATRACRVPIVEALRRAA